ncbi:MULTISPECIES: DUF1878 family protein [Salinicoccus]|uniref:DUF1878 family protein n=1 Tax=Salinicoccus TaxID=45669 RepID=UPI00068C4169|nr:MULTISPECIES: DUF1878 family protein [Salinicoccus]
MNVENEIELLKYQNKLLLSMVNGDDYPFFFFALNHDFTREQVNGIIKILNIFNNRLNNSNSTNVTDQRLEEDDKKFLMNLGINVNSLYSNDTPTYEEFSTYIKVITAHDFEIKYLLMSLKKQNINDNVCEFLLKQI